MYFKYIFVSIYLYIIELLIVFGMSFCTSPTSDFLLFFITVVLLNFEHLSLDFVYFFLCS